MYREREIKMYPFWRARIVHSSYSPQHELIFTTIQSCSIKM